MGWFYEVGRYRVRIISAALGESAGSGTPQVEVGISVIGAFVQGQGLVKVEGPDRTVYLSLTEATLGTPAEPGWVWQLLTYLGFKGPSFGDLSPLVGREEDAQCEHSEYNGQTSEKWSIWRKRTGPLNPIERQKARQLDSRFSALLRGNKERPAQATAPRPEANGQAEGPEEPAPEKPKRLPRKRTAPDAVSQAVAEAMNPHTAAADTMTETDPRPPLNPGNGQGDEIPF
jgi:hypothetical protein